MRSDPERVNDYLAALSPEERAVLERVRAAVRDSAPDANEGIAYQMPAFYSGKKFLVSYAAFKNHFSLFPASGGVLQVLGDQLRDHFTGKGTIRFTAEKPLSDEVVREIVRIRLNEVAAEADPTG